MTLVSILSAVHNEADFVEEMIESVRSQSHEDWELVFVDDGSTDETVSVIQRWAGADHRIRLAGHGSKIGKVGAFNTAFRASTGDVVVLLAGDDTLPPDSLRVRVDALAATPAGTPAVAFFKIRWFSEDPRFDGIVHPRGDRGNRSGGSITMNRALADRVFPIHESLVAEDIWLGEAAEDIAEHVIDVPHIVLNGRIHARNSHPRSQPFDVFNESMHRRHRAWQALADHEGLDLSQVTRARLAALWEAERRRHAGRTTAVLQAPGLPVVSRLALASMSGPRLYALRRRFYRLFSGWRR
jgi:glycosyltransferase involved in cell wall biosynthesis